MAKFLVVVSLLVGAFGAGYYLGQRPVGTLQRTVAELQQSVKDVSRNVMDTTLGIERDLREALGRDLVQPAGLHRHGAGVVLEEQAAGRKIERVVGIDHLRRREVLDGVELAQSARKALLVQVRRAGVVLRRAVARCGGRRRRLRAPAARGALLRLDGRAARAVAPPAPGGSGTAGFSSSGSSRKKSAS